MYTPVIEMIWDKLTIAKHILIRNTHAHTHTQGDLAFYEVPMGRIYFKFKLLIE